MKNQRWSDVPTFTELELARRWRIAFGIFLTLLAAGTVAVALASGLKP